jgi:Tol biopolymer transport system component
MNFSPDGSAIYYAIFSAADPRKGLYRVPSLGGTPRKLLAGIDSKVVFSPDGRRIAYLRSEYPQAGASSLMVANVDGSGAHALTTRRPPEFFSPIFFGSPSWSPDGKTIVCPMEKRDGPTVGTFIAVNADTGMEDQSFPHYQFDGVGMLEWTPDGTGLVAVANGSRGGDKHLWLLNPKRDERRSITSDLMDYRSVSMPNDASSIIAVASESTASIWSAPIDEAGGAKVVSSGRYDGVSGLAITPNGRILYRAVEGGTAGIWIMDENGGNRQQVTTDGVTSWPAATPDGKSIVFVREGSGLWKIGLDGRNAHAFPNTTAGLYPNVTPDGKWIFFSSTDTGVEKLWKVPMDGGDAVQVLDTNSRRPVVSPDGKQIAFFSRLGLSVMPIDGTTPIMNFRVFQTGNFAFARWTPDGKGLLHNTHQGDRPNIWLQPLSGESEHQVTHFADQNVLDFAVSADGKRLIIARGILTRDAVQVRHFR